VTDKSKPQYMIGVVAQMLGLHPQTLRMYEKKGLIRPARTVGRTRMYSPEDVEEIARVTRLARDLGVNLAGIEIILKMRRRMIEMQKQIEELTSYVRAEMARSREADPARRGQSEALVRAASSQLSPVDILDDVTGATPRERMPAHG
jgi:MerR family transcriptional regulator/heat shock protein HspR